LNHQRQMKNVTTFTTRDVGAAQIRKSTKLRPVFSAISTPIGLPTLLMLDPLLQANTSMMTKGTGFSLYLLVRCSSAPAMKRMAVTSTTSADATEQNIIRQISNVCGRGPIVGTTALTKCAS